MEGIKKSASLLLLILFVLVLACPVQAEEAEAIPPEFEVTVAGGKEAGVYSVGDEVMFEIIVSLPEDYDWARSYELGVRFTLPDGLSMYDLKDNKRIEPDMALIRDGHEYTVGWWDYCTNTYTSSSGETELEFWHTDLKTPGQSIFISEDMNVVFRIYCIVTEATELGGDGFDCKVYLTYDKEPYFYLHPIIEEPLPDYITEEQYFSVFTGAWNVQLTESGKGMPLSGGKFLLKNSEGRFFADAVGWVESSEEATAYVTDENGMLKIKGVGDGEYILEQTEAPEGYLMPEEPFSFTVSSDADRNGIHGVTVTMGEIKTESVPGTGEPTMVITNEKEFPVGIVICISAAVLALVAVGICVIVKRRK